MTQKDQVRRLMDTACTFIINDLGRDAEAYETGPEALAAAAKIRYILRNPENKQREADDAITNILREKGFGGCLCGGEKMLYFDGIMFTWLKTFCDDPNREIVFQFAKRLISKLPKEQRQMLVPAQIRTVVRTSTCGNCSDPECGGCSDPMGD